jgi:hypothetical protein
MGPLAALCCGTLALFLARPDLAWSLVIIAASGALGCYQVAANTGFMQALSRDRQAQAFGIATAGIWTAQGLAYLAAGAAADIVPPAVVISASGIAGAVAAAALALSWRTQIAPPGSAPASAAPAPGRRPS